MRLRSKGKPERNDPAAALAERSYFMPRKRKHEAHGEEDVEARWAQHNEHVLVSERQRQAAGASMILQQTGVERLAVGANDAHALVMYLEEHWADGELKMCTKALTKRAHGFANYQKVLHPLNSEAQRLNTILLPSAQLNMARMIIAWFQQHGNDVAFTDSEHLWRRRGTVLSSFPSARAFELYNVRCAPGHGGV